MGFVEVFNKEFKLLFMFLFLIPAKSIKARCDQTRMKAADGNPEEISTITHEMDLHQRTPESARIGLTNDTLAANRLICNTRNLRFNENLTY